MFAVIKKNEGLAKVIDAPSLKAAYDKLMYSEEDMLEPGTLLLHTHITTCLLSQR